MRTTVCGAARLTSVVAGKMRLIKRPTFMEQTVLDDTTAWRRKSLDLYVDVAATQGFGLLASHACGRRALAHFPLRAR